MGPTWREWLGAGLLVLVLVVLIALLVMVSVPTGGEDEASIPAREVAALQS